MKQKIIFLIGFMASGKSTVGKQLGELMAAEFIDLDHWIEEKTGMSIPLIFQKKGESHFRDLEKKYLREIIEQFQLSAFESKKTGILVVATGGGTPCFFDNLARMKVAGHTIYLKATISVIFDRLKKRRVEVSERPLLSFLKKESALLLFIQKKLAQRAAIYEESQDVILIKESTTLEEVCGEIRRKVGF